MKERQHVWLGPDTETFEEQCEACLGARESVASRNIVVSGHLRRDADVGFMTCRRGHRIIVHRIARHLTAVR
ncbi:MAG TPA: hypothetical protein VGH52_11890 [Gaiellaceae bacterium]|jgi:hypothetical protein